MYDEPKGFGALLASMYEAGARGLLDQHSNDFEQLVHDKPQTFPEFLKMNNKNRTCDDSHRTSYSYIIKFNDIICYRNRKYQQSLMRLNLISLKRVERLLYHVQLQSVCSATLNTPKVAIEPKRDKFLFKKLAKIKAANFYSTS